MTLQAQNDDDDPNKENEAEAMLEYIEKFTELIEDGHYEEAALHAANSPKGILRTHEILNRFKGRCICNVCMCWCAYLCMCMFVRTSCSMVSYSVLN